MTTEQPERERMTEDKWEPIFYGYEVSSLGRVRSVDRVISTKNGDRRYPGKVLKQHIDHRGYCRVTLDFKSHKVHRLVAMAYLPNHHDYPHINHIDGDKLNNHASNLEWCTSSHNNAHAIRTGLNPCRGEGHYASTLSAWDVRVMRACARLGHMTIVEIGNAFGTKPSTASAIIRRKNWKHI